MKKRIINRYPEINSFGSRLVYLYDLKGFLKDGKIDFSDISKTLYNLGLCEYGASDGQVEKGKKRKYTADTLRTHATDKYNDMSSKWLDIYCKFFNCSCDFLMGYIDRPTYEKTDIGTYTGLSDRAIDMLHYMATHTNEITPHPITEITSDLITSPGFCRLLDGIVDYIHLDYNIPIYHTGKLTEIDGLPYHEMQIADKCGDYNPNAKKYNLHFAKSKGSIHTDFTSVTVDRDFLEALSFDKIKKALEIIKREAEKL